MNKYVAAYAGTALVMAALDMLWLGFFAYATYDSRTLRRCANGRGACH